MQLRKWGMLVLCSLMLTAFTGCTPKEEEPEPPQIEIEEAKEELSREIKKYEEKRRSYTNDKAIELYPELKEIKAHLFETYADVLIAEESKVKDGKPPIDIGYWGGGEYSIYGNRCKF